MNTYNEMINKKLISRYILCYLNNEMSNVKLHSKSIDQQNGTSYFFGNAEQRNLFILTSLNVDI